MVKMVAQTMTQTLKAGTWIRNDFMPRDSRATTLIELLVVIVILSISAAILFPRLHTSQTESARLERSAQQLVRVIKRAQNLAIGTQTVHVLHLNLESQTYSVSAKSFQGEEVPVDQGLGLRGALASGVFFAQILRDDLQDPAIRQVTWPFDPEGRGLAGRVVLSGDQGHTLDVVVGNVLDINGPCFVSGGKDDTL
jgi:type II secretory pathway pseudopilin PulG